MSTESGGASRRSRPALPRGSWVIAFILWPEMSSPRPRQAACGQVTAAFEGSYLARLSDDSNRCRSLWRPGATLYSRRPAEPEYPGLKVQVTGTAEAAQVWVRPSETAAPSWRYPNLMVGDQLWGDEVSVRPRLFVGRTRSVPYHELFISPRQGSPDLRLSEAGRDLLGQVAAEYGPLPLPILYVKGYTEADGSEDAGRQESYRRALAVRNFLVDQHRFDPNRVLAFGLGGRDQVDTSFAGEYQEQNRRVEFSPGIAPDAAASTRAGSSPHQP